MNQPNSLQRTGCGSYFHAKCLKDWHKESRKCPTCDKIYYNAVVDEGISERTISKERQQISNSQKRTPPAVPLNNHDSQSHQQEGVDIIIPSADPGQLEYFIWAIVDEKQSSFLDIIESRTGGAGNK